MRNEIEEELMRQADREEEEKKVLNKPETEKEVLSAGQAETEVEELLKEYDLADRPIGALSDPGNYYSKSRLM